MRQRDERAVIPSKLVNRPRPLSNGSYSRAQNSPENMAQMFGPSTRRDAATPGLALPNFAFSPHRWMGI